MTSAQETIINELGFGAAARAELASKYPLSHTELDAEAVPAIGSFDDKFNCCEAAIDLADETEAVEIGKAAKAVVYSGRTKVADFSH